MLGKCYQKSTLSNLSHVDYALTNIRLRILGPGYECSVGTLSWCGKESFLFFCKKDIALLQTTMATNFPQD